MRPATNSPARRIASPPGRARRRAAARRSRSGEQANRRLLIGGLLIIFALVAPARAEWRLVEEHWYEMFIAGARAGWMSERVLDDGERYKSETETQMRIDRGGQTIEVLSKNEFIETHEGAAVSGRSEMTMSAQPVTTSWVFHDDHLVQDTLQGGRTTTARVDRPEGDWLTPVAAGRFAEERRSAGAKRFSYRALLPENSIEPVRVDVTAAGEAEYETGGRTIPVTVWTAVTSVVPVEATEYYSKGGHLVYQKVPLGGVGLIEMRVADKAAVLRNAGGPPPELLVSSFVQPSRPIRDVMHRRQLQMKLATREGEMPALPDSGAQRVTRMDASTAVLTVDMDDNVPATDAERADTAFREPSAMVNSDDPLIGKLVARTIKGAGEDPLARAESLRSLAFRHVTAKDLDTAFASAAETAAMKRGDCSEHAVLLAAMLRAANIPSRVACGLVYVDRFGGASNVFGWHMWTQGLIDGRWVDLDATLPVPYHAGHVTVSTTSLADGGGLTELATVVMLMGNLEIEILESDT